jgi:hypothetical protein
MFLHEFTSLSELINDNNHMFFAPKERLTSSKLLDCYHKYQAWYGRLPASICVDAKKESEPHVLVLQYVWTILVLANGTNTTRSMLYWTIIVHLFRPLLKVDLIHSDIRPRDICVDAANKVYYSLFALCICSTRKKTAYLDRILSKACKVWTLFTNVTTLEPEVSGSYTRWRRHGSCLFQESSADPH